MHNKNWDDLRYVLTVAQTGSVLKASKKLGVNHATVLRHVASFEERHGTTIFERTSRGYQLIADRAHLIRAAEEAEAAMKEVSRLAVGGPLSLRGTVKVTSTDTLCTTILPKFVATLLADEVDVRVSLLSSNTYLNMQREEAHITVRPAARLMEGMVGEQAAELGFAAYALDQNQKEWLGLAGPLSRSVASDWMNENLPEDDLLMTADSFLTLREMAARGQGIAVLPCLVGDNDDRLVRLQDALARMSVPLWVARHNDTIETPHMRAVHGRLMRFLGEHAAVLSGDVTS